MLSPWVQPLLTIVVATICILTTALAVDCHLITRQGDGIEACKGSDQRALATLTGVLSVLLALRVPTDDDRT